MRSSRLAPSTALLTIPLMAIAGMVEIGAQEMVTSGSDEFDIGRAMIRDGTVYEPFMVTDEARPLREALGDGTLQEHTLLLIIEHSKGRLALVRDQMSYHHAAQGEIAGEPWMVSF